MAPSNWPKMVVHSAVEGGSGLGSHFYANLLDLLVHSSSVASGKSKVRPSLDVGASLVLGHVLISRNGLVGDIDTDDAGLRLAARDGKRHASLKNFRSRGHEEDLWYKSCSTVNRASVQPQSEFPL